MTDSEGLLTRVALARRQLIETKNELAMAKGRLKQTDEAREVKRLTGEVEYAKELLNLVLAQVDDVYQPSLMDMPGTTTFSDGERSVTLTHEQLSKAAALTGEQLSKIVRGQHP